MTEIIFNGLLCLGLVLITTGTICSFRVMYHAKNPGHWWYGCTLMYRPDLLTPKGRRLCGIAWLCYVAFVFIWFVCFCLAHTAAMANR